MDRHMQLTLYKNFSKRKNSTKQPSESGTIHEVHLLDGCSTEAPAFLINGIDLDVNYCKWNNSYFFITDIVLSNNNIYELHCEMDSLATWKNVIGASTQFIERANSDYDPMINDAYIAGKQKIVNVGTETVTLGAFSINGCYIFPCVNAYGMQIYATEDITAFAPLFYPGTYQKESFSDWLKQGIASIGDVAQYFGRVTWVPIPINWFETFPREQTAISVGAVSWPIPEGTRWCWPDFTIEQLYAHYIPHFDGYYNDFRDSSPQYVKYELFLPGVGTVEIDPMVANDPDRYIHIGLFLSPATGDVTYDLLLMTLSGGRASRVGHYHGNVSANVPYGISSTDYSRVMTNLTNNAASGVMSIASNVASENYIGAAAASASTVGGIVAATAPILFPSANIIGGSGNLSEVKNFHNIVMTRTVYDAAGIPKATSGRPLHQYRTINTLSGYIKCAGASIDVPGVASEKDTINAYLNGGFYYE